MAFPTTMALSPTLILVESPRVATEYTASLGTSLFLTAITARSYALLLPLT